MSSTGHGLVATIVALGVGLWSPVPPARAEAWRVHGRGGEADWGETPWVVELKLPIPPGSYALTAGNSAAPIDAIVFRDGNRLLLATVLPRVPARQAFAYTMRRQSEPDPRDSGGIRFGRRERNLLVTLDDGAWTEYRLDVGNKPFFFPLVGPGGQSYTRAYPMATVAGEDRDHPHQRSCWFTYGNLNGIDFWSEGPGTGTIRESDRKVVVQGPVLGRLRTQDRWRAPDGRTICDDERTVTFYRTKGPRIIDFEIHLNATAGPVTFRDTKEGMFGLRVASSMDVDKKTGGRITNAEGLTDQKAWGQASPWVDYVGPVGGRTVGLAILNHPDSFRYPTTWHVRTYGLFAANPFGWHDFGRTTPGDYTVEAGRSIRFLYRVILHEGDTASNGVAAQFEAYARPPHAEIELE
jgi:hypothetical protein